MEAGQIRSKVQWLRALFANYLDENALPSVSVELPIEDLLPGAKIEFALGDGDHDFAAHDLPFHVRIGVFFSSPVVMILGNWGVRSQLFQPCRVIMKEALLVVVYEYRRGYMHGVDQAKSFNNTAFPNQVFNSRRDVNKANPIRHFKPKLFCK